MSNPMLTSRSKSHILLWHAILLMGLSGCFHVTPATVITPLATKKIVENVAPTASPLKSDSTATFQPPTLPIIPSTIPTNKRMGWIVFSSARDGTRDLYLLSPDGETVIPLGLHGLEPEFPTWSPDWQQIAFTTRPVNGQNGIYAVNAGCVDLPGGCREHALSLTADTPGLYVAPDWSPDGKKIVFAYRRTTDPTEPFYIWVMNADGTSHKRLSAIEGSDPDWSPDGQMIAFASHFADAKWGVEEDGTQCFNCGDVFVMNADGTNLKRLTSILPDSDQPAWSPDGHSIIVISAEGHDLSEGNRYTYLYNVEISGSVVKRLGADIVHGVSPAWSPDGSKIVFKHNYGGLYLINIDGSSFMQLTEDESDSSPVWQP